jgi:hypothetical protein
MANMKKQTATNVGKDEGRGAYLLLVRIKISTVTMQISMEFPQETKNRTTI